MKKIIIALFGLGMAVAHADSVKYLENKWDFVPVMGNTVLPINLDSSEVDTGVNVRLSRLAVFGNADTVGTASVTCKDSSGTDSIAVVMRWQGSMVPDGTGTWANIDSVELKDLASPGVYTSTTKAVKNTAGYQVLRFSIRNKRAVLVAKATCTAVGVGTQMKIGTVR